MEGNADEEYSDNVYFRKIVERLVKYVDTLQKITLVLENRIVVLEGKIHAHE